MTTTCVCSGEMTTGRGVLDDNIWSMGATTVGDNSVTVTCAFLDNKRRKGKLLECLLAHLASICTSIEIEHRISIEIEHRISIEIEHRTSIEIEYRISIEIKHRISIEIEHRISIEIEHRISIEIEHRTSKEIKHRTS